MNVYTILGSATTVLAFVAFIGIVAWAYGSGRRKAFDEAANAPFALPDEAEEGSRSTAPGRARTGGNGPLATGDVTAKGTGVGAQQ